MPFADISEALRREHRVAEVEEDGHGHEQPDDVGAAHRRGLRRSARAARTQRATKSADSPMRNSSAVVT
jgi:hypothetical protein